MVVTDEKLALMLKDTLASIKDYTDLKLDESQTTKNPGTVD